MNDDFAPRPKCGCRLLMAGFVMSSIGFSVMSCTAYGWYLMNAQSRRALAESQSMGAEQQATIDQQARIIQAWVDEHPPTDGEIEDGKMGARILPTIRHSAEEANGAIIEMRDLGKRISKTFDDVEAGRTGLKVKFSLMKGEAHIVLEKQP